MEVERQLERFHWIDLGVRRTRQLARVDEAIGA
jgi:hypothetical protein